MGWVSSPPYFCAATETVADLANATARTSHEPSPHRLDEVSEPAVPDSPPPPTSAPCYEVYDPVPILQIFGARYRDGRIAPSKKLVRAGSVDDALRAVGQTFARMGSKDIRKDSLGNIDFRLQRQLRRTVA
jgi:hypothetical protein